jgi:aminomethyltransferase
MDESNNPYELGLDKFVDLEQGVDFLGKKALKKIKAAGIERKLVGLVMHSEPLSQSAERWSVHREGEPIGTITSAIYSPDLEKNIAMAMVGIDDTEVGTQLTIIIGQENVPATITALPFIDNRDKVWRGSVDS